MKYLIIIPFVLFSGCMDVREYNGKSFTIRLVAQSIEPNRCRYEIETNGIFSPNILYFDKCGKWQVNDKIHLAKD